MLLLQAIESLETLCSTYLSDNTEDFQAVSTSRSTVRYKKLIVYLQK